MGECSRLNIPKFKLLCTQKCNHDSYITNYQCRYITINIATAHMTNNTYT